MREPPDSKPVVGRVGQNLDPADSRSWARTTSTGPPVVRIGSDQNLAYPKYEYLVHTISIRLYCAHSKSGLRV